MNSLIFTLYGAYISILDLAITYFFLCIYKNYVKISNNLLKKPDINKNSEEMAIFPFFFK